MSPDLYTTPLDYHRVGDENGGGSAGAPSRIPPPSRSLPLSRVLCTRLRRYATSRGTHLEALIGVVESWLVGVERDDEGRKEGEGPFASKTSVSRRLKGSMTARNDCTAEF